ncbi:MAG: helix-turn-helix domain-containing protein [Clostridiales bacterium]|nr:helix-turn-helix domain-containing protein [Clostridiales bacterium]
MNPIRILSVTPVSRYRLVILCDDETIRLWSFSFPDRALKNHPLRDKSLFWQAEVSPDGLRVTWPNGEVRYASELCRTGKLLPLSLSDLAELCCRNVLSTSEVAELLDCTRQNVDSLAVRGKLRPLKSYKRNRLFLLADVVRRRWWSADALPPSGASVEAEQPHNSHPQGSDGHA